MKRYCSIIAALMLLGVGTATAAYRSVVVERHDGTSMAIGMEADMTAKITEGILEFSCPKGVVSLPTEEVHFWSFSKTEATTDLWTGIAESAVEAVAVRCSDAAIYLSGLGAGTQVSLASVNGSITGTAKADATGRASIDTSGLQAGVYILSYGSHSVKLFMTR